MSGHSPPGVPSSSRSPVRTPQPPSPAAAASAGLVNAIGAGGHQSASSFNAEEQQQQQQPPPPQQQQQQLSPAQSVGMGGGLGPMSSLGLVVSPRSSPATSLSNVPLSSNSPASTASPQPPPQHSLASGGLQGFGHSPSHSAYGSTLRSMNSGSHHLVGPPSPASRHHPPAPRVNTPFQLEDNDTSRGSPTTRSSQNVLTTSGGFPHAERASVSGGSLTGVVGGGGGGGGGVGHSGMRSPSTTAEDLFGGMQRMYSSSMISATSPVQQTTQLPPAPPNTTYAAATHQHQQQQQQGGGVSPPPAGLAAVRTLPSPPGTIHMSTPLLHSGGAGAPQIPSLPPSVPMANNNNNNNADISSNSNHNYIPESASNASSASTSAAVAAATALSLRTITEQQLIIRSLQELVQATKSRVAYLEDVNRSLRKEQGGQQEVPPLLMEELVSLRTNNVKLLQQASVLIEEKALLQDQLDSCHIALADLESRYEKQLLRSQELQGKETSWKQQSALLRLSETERKKLQIENMELREDLDRSAFEKKRWRALVQTLSCRLHPSLNSHIEKHIHAMVMEEEKRYQASLHERKARQAALIAEVERRAAEEEDAARRRANHPENGDGPFSGFDSNGNSDDGSRDQENSGGLFSSDADTGGEGRSMRRVVPAWPKPGAADSSTEIPSSQMLSEYPSADFMAVWQKSPAQSPSHASGAGGGGLLGPSPQLSDASGGSPAASKAANREDLPLPPGGLGGGAKLSKASGGGKDHAVLPPSPSSRGTLANLPFRQDQALPPRAPGSTAIGLFEEDPRYNFGPGTLPIQMLQQHMSSSGAEGPKYKRRGGALPTSSGSQVSTKSLNQILQPEERKRKKLEEGKKGRHLVPL